MAYRSFATAEQYQNDSESKFIAEICEVLGIDENENQSNVIAKHLLTNGRQGLNEYRAHIARKDFDIQMKNDGSSELLQILKRYYLQQWQHIPFEWFNSFMTSHQSEEDTEQHERVLIRLADYGVKFLKTCPVFSIVLQIVFEFDDEITTTDNVFDDIWNSFIIHGYNMGLDKSDKYLIPAVKKKYINAFDSVLFRALRECFRQPILTLFDGCNINKTRRNLLDITLDFLAKLGWKGGLEDSSVVELIAEVQYEKLISKRNEYLAEKQLSDIISKPLLPSNPDDSSRIPVVDNPNQLINVQPQFTDYSQPSCQPTNQLVQPNPLQFNPTTVSTQFSQLTLNNPATVINSPVSQYTVTQNMSTNKQADMSSSQLQPNEPEEGPPVEKPVQLANNTIAQRWMEVFQSNCSPNFEVLSMQFSNIIKVTIFSIKEAQAALQQRIISINDEFIGKIFLRADCSYLEEIPRSKPKITSERLFCYIVTQLEMSDRLRTDRNYCQEKADALFQQLSSLPPEMKRLKSLFHIQYNEESSNAVIIASSTVYQWLAMKFVNIQNELIFKTANISCKLIIKPIPNDLSSAAIFSHTIFQNSVKQNNYKRIGENLVVEITDSDVYNKCLNIRFIEIIHNEDQLRLQIVPYTYTAVINPEDADINEENWYSARMLDHKPDITQFDPRHPIFRYKWNSKIWLEQFTNVTKQFANTNDSNERRKHDLFRRMLRVTVMLKTIGAIRAKKYDLEDVATKTEIKIEPLTPLVTIVYNHQSKLTESAEMNSRLPPFESTSVRVMNEDCLISYAKQVAAGYKPLLLNMANASTPGGGYRKGDGAQEENLFRRSNYYLSLDPTLTYQEDQLDNCQWLYCSETTERKRLDIKQKSWYPIDEFGGIYSSGITVLRGTEDAGYPFLPKPIYNFCSLAIAAFRNPPVHDNIRLSLKYAIGTRRKIENFFAIAHQHGHNCLILSALGCGAFKNPPEHVALIFKSVIIQYAGFFQKIIFSIIDDHNTGNQMNPDGNFLPFQKVLDDFCVRPVMNPTVGMAIGPYYIIESQNKGKSVRFDNVSILNLPACEYGTKCRDLYDPQHRQSYTHPPLCPMGSECTDMENDVHLQSFSHRRACPQGGLCESIDNQQHMFDYIHPNFCSEGGSCTNMKTLHLSKFRHVSLCRHGIDCKLNLQMVKEHQLKYRHCQISCPFGGNCVHFHDQDHIKRESHPFKTPCPQTPFSCELFVEYLQSSNLHEDYNTNRKEFKDLEYHCLHYSHVCPWGRQCNDKTPKHLSTTIHIARKMCPDGDKMCQFLTNEDHLESFTHTDVRDIRLECRYSATKCQDLKIPVHTNKYRHNYRQDFLGVAQYFGLNKTIDFVFNQDYITLNLQEYFEKKHNIKWTRVSTPNNLLNWIRALQPVHRCSATIFESILVHGHVMSRAHMDQLKEEKFVAHSANEHNTVRKIVSRNVSAVQDNVHDFIAALVKMEFYKKGDKIFYTSSQSDSQIQFRIESKEQAIQAALKSDEIDEIRNCAIQVAQASITLHSNQTGIGFTRDVELGTNQHVFAILGPHTGQYYGDIVVVFKREIMLHPDSNFTMQAATTYTPPEPDKVPKAYKFRPWLQDPGTMEGRLKNFHQTKLHCSVPGSESVTALELIAITGGQNNPMKADLKHIIQRWLSVDSHQVIETHLPQLIPLSYVDHIYMPKNVFSSLSLVAQKNAETLFGKKLTVTEHIVDLNVELMAFAEPDASRKGYHKYILEKLIGLIGKQEETVSIEQHLKYYGVTFTMPPSYFQTYVTSPMTICQSQSRYLSSSKNQSNSDDCVYIYWKAVGGDFMLILTNERIEAGKVQQNLVYLTCYIASLATNAGTGVGYDERHTYISNSPPTRHSIVLQSQQFKTGSNTFHKGCNPNYYILYCLRINLKTGEVSLVHAGVNGIYNRTSLSYKFSKKELDISTLNYVHVSSGSQNISIRNLIISHEQIPEAHPKFDRNFTSNINDVETIDVSELQPKPSSSTSPNVSPKVDGERNSMGISVTDAFGRFGNFVKNLNPFGSSNVSTMDTTDEFDFQNSLPPFFLYYTYPCILLLEKTTSHQDNKFHTSQHIRETSTPAKSSPRTSFTTNVHTADKTSSQKLPITTNTSHHGQSSSRTINFGNTRSNTRHKETLGKSSYDWVANSEEESDEEDSILDFYNADAGKSSISNASEYDQYGNPKGTTYDLGKDGAFKDFSILIAQFYQDGQFNDTAIKVPIDALKVKGFQVKHVKSENECISEFQSNRHQIAWIISTSSIQNSAFISALTKYHSSGGAVFLFADNVPFVSHAAEFLKAKFGIILEGDYYGSKTLTYMENGHDKPGHYGQHQIFTGIQKLFEGITICHPVYSTAESRKQFVNVATATDGQPTVGVYDPPPNLTEGRLALDCGFTKLYCNWDSAGTARYIVNVSTWLLAIEKRIKGKKKKPRM
ncbi:unnamed protein product [Rotaria sordida]|uniref:Microbial-type PARG catalytic domain-containing protein n=1 Tax=Rotaria sordida TaxID=392033 RepID=A0A819JI51_9BILA|nr:unnamed protein product [Rotaria sordida]